MKETTDEVVNGGEERNCKGRRVFVCVEVAKLSTGRLFWERSKILRLFVGRAII